MLRIHDCRVDSLAPASCVFFISLPTYRYYVSVRGRRAPYNAYLDGRTNVTLLNSSHLLHATEIPAAFLQTALKIALALMDDKTVTLCHYQLAIHPQAHKVDQLSRLFSLCEVPP